MKELKPNQNGLLETFTFGDVTSTEQIESLWSNGIDFVDVGSAGELRSEVVEVGTTYIVQRQGKFYLIDVVEVNETPDNNNDNYVVDIKY